MDNQYNYYKPEEQYQYQYGSAPNQQNNNKNPKNSLGKKILIAIILAIVFGSVGGVTFTGVSYVTKQVLGLTDKEIESEETIDTVPIRETYSTVTSDVSGIVENSLPTIVSITNMSVEQVQDFFFGGITERESESAGSGFIISQSKSELLIATNNHVIDNSRSLTVTFCDGTSVEAKVKGTDSGRDLAVVSVKLKDIPEETRKEIKVASLGDSNELKVGEPLIAIGNALGYGQSVTSGIVSATERKIEGFNGQYIQTDAAINPGNSGGPLLNIKGEVIGINSVKINTTVAEGMGFAIPISDAQEIIQKLMNRETREKVDEGERGYIGVAGYDVTSEVAQMYNMPVGLYIAEVIEGSGAEKAGLTMGMIITKFENTSVDGQEDISEQLSYYRAGEKVTLTVSIPQNDGEYKEKEFEVELSK